MKQLARNEELRWSVPYESSLNSQTNVQEHGTSEDNMVVDPSESNYSVAPEPPLRSTSLRETQEVEQEPSPKDPQIENMPTIECPEQIRWEIPTNAVRMVSGRTEPTQQEQVREQSSEPFSQPSAPSASYAADDSLNQPSTSRKSSEKNIEYLKRFEWIMKDHPKRQAVSKYARNMVATTDEEPRTLAEALKCPHAAD